MLNHATFRLKSQVYDCAVNRCCDDRAGQDGPVGGQAFIGGDELDASSTELVGDLVRALGIQRQKLEFDLTDLQLCSCDRGDILATTARNFSL